MDYLFVLVVGLAVGAGLVWAVYHHVTVSSLKADLADLKAKLQGK